MKQFKIVLSALFLSSILSACSNPLGSHENYSKIDDGFLSVGIKAQDEAIHILKNELSEVTLHYIEENGIYAKSCELLEVKNFSVVTPCVCENKICKTQIKPHQDFIGEGSFSYFFTDNYNVKGSVGTYSLIVSSTNSAPTLNAISNKVVKANEVLSVALEGSDTDSELSCSSFTAQSLSEDIIPSANLTILGQYPYCLLSIQSLPNVKGPSQITVSLKDGVGALAKTIFTQFFVTVTNPPSSPSTLVATKDSSHIKLSWNNPTSGALPITYNLYRKTASSAYELIETNLPSPSYVDENVDVGVKYFYSISATNSDGHSNHSNEVEAKLIAPFQISNIASSSSVILSWASTVGAESYDVYVGSAPNDYQTVLSNQSSPLALTGLSAGSTYYIKVKAKNFFTSVDSSEVVVSPVNSVSNLAISINSTDSLILNWSAALGATNYSVQYGSDLNLMTSTISCSSFPCTISGIGPGGYFFQVISSNNIGFGSSQTSAAASAEAIGSFSITNASSEALSLTKGSVSIDWSTATGATSYDVVYNINAGADIVVNTSSNSYSLSNLDSGSTFSFKVVAKNAYGSVSSSQDSITVLGLFSESLSFTNSLDYTADSDVELSSGSATLISKSAVMQKTYDGSATAFDTALDEYSVKDANVTVSQDKITLSSGNSGIYITKALDRAGTTALTGLSYLTSLPLVKKLRWVKKRGMEVRYLISQAI